VATRVPLDGRVFLEKLPQITHPAKTIPTAQRAAKMVPLPLIFLQPPRPTEPSPEPESVTSDNNGSPTDIRFPLPPGKPLPLALPRWLILDELPGWWKGEWEAIGLIRLYKRGHRIEGEAINCNGEIEYVGPFRTTPGVIIRGWKFIDFVPCPWTSPPHPEVLPLVEPAQPHPEIIPYLPNWVPALPEIQPSPSEEPTETPETEPPPSEEPDQEDEEEETRPLPIPLPLPLPAPVPPVPEVPAPVPNEKETKRRLAPVPVEVPSIDPKRAPVPVTEPKPSPWKVEPELPVKVPQPDPLTTPPPTREPAPQPQPQPQPVVPPPATLILESVRKIPAEKEVVRTETEVYIVKRKRKKIEIETEEPEPEKCEELDCLKIWCGQKEATLSFYEGEWEDDGYVAKSRNESVVIPGPLGELVKYINDRLSDIKRELCEAIDLIAFLDHEPEAFTDRRKYGPQWKIYWGKRNRTQNSMKRLTLPEIERMDRPPKPPVISDGKICLHYGIESVSFWGRIWVGSSSAEALEGYLRQIYGERVKFTRSENPGREYKRGRLVPTRARYWNGERWLPPVRWDPRPWESR
jgi:hypothetical protein